MTHSFDIKDAEAYGVNCAVILYNIRFWVAKNKANDKHNYDGKYWTYNSIKAFHELFPYLTEKQIRTALDKLVEVGVVQKGNYNENPYDRTSWYSTEVKCTRQKEEKDLPLKETPFAHEGESLIGTDINTDINLLKEDSPPKQLESNKNTNILGAEWFESVPLDGEVSWMFIVRQVKAIHPHTNLIQVKSKAVNFHEIEGMNGTRKPFFEWTKHFINWCKHQKFDKVSTGLPSATHTDWKGR